MTDSTLQNYFRLMTMNGGVRTFHAARTCGLLAELGSAPKTVQVLASACNLNIRACQLLLNVLADLGLAETTDNGFTGTPLLKLLTGPYASLSDLYWDHLPAFLQTGIPMQRMDDPKEAESHYVQQVVSLDWMMRASAQAICPKLTALLPEHARILDIGAGSGVWSLSVAGCRSDINVVAVDRPAVLQIASQHAEQASLADRFIGSPGDLFDPTYSPFVGSDQLFDMAIVANVCHGLTREQIQMILQRIHGWLKTNGYLVVIDILKVVPSANLTASLYELGLALRTTHGQVHSEDSLRAKIADTGFLEMRAEAINAPPHIMGAIISRKGQQASA